MYVGNMRIHFLAGLISLALAAPSFSQGFSLNSVSAKDIPALPAARFAAPAPLVSGDAAGARAEADAWFARNSFGGHSIKHLGTGVESFDERIKLMDSARRSIYISAFAFDHDETARAYVAKLCEKAGQGVEVRMLVDSLGGAYMKDIRNEVRDCGISLLFYAPAYWGLNYLPQAMHEKLLIVDGERLIMGGMGWSNKYYQSGRDSDVWYDQDVRIDGPSACWFHRVFMDTFKKTVRKEKQTRFSLYEREDSGDLQDYLYGSEYYSDCDEVNAGNSRVLPAYNNPVYGKTKVRASMQTYIRLARESWKTIDIYSPYMVLHDDVQRVMIEAAKRGVRVRFLTNSRESTDEPIAEAGMFASVGKLLDAGVEIYLWPKKSLLHRKGGVFDGHWAFLGSDNFDRRGQLYSSESVAFTDEAELVAGTQGEMQADFAISTRLTPELAQKELSRFSAIRRWLAARARPFL